MVASMHLRVNKLANVCKVLLALASLKWAKQGTYSARYSVDLNFCNIYFLPQ